jgi:molecular chaperone GrpE
MSPAMSANPTSGAGAEPGTESIEIAAAPQDAAALLAAATAKADDNWNQYLRAVAELENYRRRAEREVDNARKFAIERFAQELIGVGDALESGLAAGGSDPESPIVKGAQATLRQLLAAFQKAGIAVVDPAGKPFDPNWHEAIVAQESSSEPPGTVLSVIQRGYTINGRLLRPARVIVSRAPAAPAAENT